MSLHSGEVEISCLSLQVYIQRFSVFLGRAETRDESYKGAHGSTFYSYSTPVGKEQATLRYTLRSNHSI